MTKRALRKSSIIGLLFAVVASLTSAQSADDGPTTQPDSTWTVRATFKAGDSAIYDLRKTRWIQKPRNSRPVTVVCVWRCSVRVVDVRDETFTVEWTAGPISFEPAIEMSPLERKIVDLMAELPVRMTYGQDGSLLRLDNAKEVEERNEMGLELTEQMLRQKGTDEVTIQQAMAQTRKMFEKPEVLAQAMTRDIRPLFFGYGRKLVAGQPHQQSTTMANAMGGNPLPATDTTEPSNWKAGEPRPEQLRYSCIFRGDADALIQSIRASMPQLEVGADDEHLDIEQVSTHDFEFDSHSGWMLKAKMVARVGTPDQLKIDEVSFMLVDWKSADEPTATSQPIESDKLSEP